MACVAILSTMCACDAIQYRQELYEQETQEEETSSMPLHDDYTVMAKLPNGEVVFSKKGDYQDTPSYVYFTATDGTKYKVNKEDVVYFIRQE